jgi:hypothetical protein
MDITVTTFLSVDAVHQGPAARTRTAVAAEQAA